jgi:hypothetical protein
VRNVVCKPPGTAAADGIRMPGNVGGPEIEGDVRGGSGCLDT